MQRVHSLTAHRILTPSLSLFAERISETAAANYGTIEEQKYPPSRRELAAFKPVLIEITTSRYGDGTAPLVRDETGSRHRRRCKGIPLSLTKSEDGAVPGYVPLIFAEPTRGLGLLRDSDAG